MELMFLKTFCLIALLSILSSRYVRCDTPLSPGEHTVVLNGVRLWYQVAGQLKSGQAPLVFLAGGPGYNTYSFAKIAGEQLERHTQMIYFDERGTGHSERPWTGVYDMPTLVEDIEDLRKSLGIPQISLMGHSFGGTVALEYAARYPAHVRKLIILDGAVDLPKILDLWASEIQQKYPLAWNEAMRGETGVALRDARRKADTCAVSKAQFALEMFVLGKVDRGEFHRWQQFHDQRYQKEEDALDAASGLRNTGELSNAYFAPDADFLCYSFHAFRKLTMPTLVIVGKYDGSVGMEQMRSLAKKLPDARFDEFNGSAHFVYAEEPAKFGRDVVAFLGEP